MRRSRVLEHQHTITLWAVLSCQWFQVFILAFSRAVHLYTPRTLQDDRPYPSSSLSAIELGFGVKTTSAVISRSLHMYTQNKFGVSITINVNSKKKKKAKKQETKSQEEFLLDFNFV